MTKQSLRTAARLLRGSYFYLFLQLVLDTIAAKGVAQNGSTTEPPYHLHLPATGGGNIGDQAMLDAYLQSVSGPVVLVMEDASALHVSEGDKSRVSVEVLPGIVSSAAGLRHRQVRRFSELLCRAKSFSVAGADVMDGLYNASQSIARVSMLRLANAKGVPTSVLGFSWSQNAVPSVTLALKLLRGVTRLCVRDPKSVERLTASGVAGVVSVADGVFSLSPMEVAPDVSEWISGVSDSGLQFAVVNISGLIGARMDQASEYSVLLDELHNLNYSVLYLPHVIRDGDNDLYECRRLFAAHGRPEDLLIERTLAPSEIRFIVDCASVVVTGRMHLAIMSLSRITPVITLGTQGKVEGLYQMFDLPSLLVFPKPGFGSSVRQVLGELHRDRPNFLRRIEEALPGVRALSLENYSNFSK